MDDCSGLFIVLSLFLYKRPDVSNEQDPPRRNLCFLVLSWQNPGFESNQGNQGKQFSKN